MNPARPSFFRVELVEVVDLPLFVRIQEHEVERPSSYGHLDLSPLMSVTRSDSPASLTCRRAKFVPCRSISGCWSADRRSPPSPSPIQIAENTRGKFPPPGHFRRE